MYAEKRKIRLKTRQLQDNCVGLRPERSFYVFFGTINYHIKNLKIFSLLSKTTLNIHIIGIILVN
jgi:hypothetical protein